MRLAGGFNAAVHLFTKRRRCYDSVAGGCKHAALLGQQQITNNPVATPILLAIVWGAGFGGFGSPLGSSSNLVAISYLEKLTGHEFMYVDWVIRFLPLLFIIMLLILAYLLHLPLPVKRLDGGKEYFRTAYAKLGPMSRGEKLGLWLFCSRNRPGLRPSVLRAVSAADEACLCFLHLWHAHLYAAQRNRPAAFDLA